MQRTVLRIVPLAALLISAAVAILFGALPQSTASERSLQPQKPLRTPLTQTAGLVVVFESPDDAADVLPGERVKFRVSVENPTDRPQTNLLVGMVVSQNVEALGYVDYSTFAIRGDRKSSLPTLDKRETRLAETFEPHESVTVEWEMMVSECTARDRWVQVVFVARTDEESAEPKFKNLYLHPHISIPTQHFTPSYHVDPQSPAPGDAVRHTVRVVNDGFIRLDNIVIHVNGHETIDRYLPTIAASSAYYVVPRRGSEGTSPIAIDSGWSGPDTGFNLAYLNPGQTLILSWIDYVASDAPVGTVVRPQVDIRPDQADEWKSVARRLTVSPPANDLSMSIRSIDPEYLAPFYLPGDRVTMRVTVTNHSATARDDLHVDLDLPFALSYIPGSAYLCVGQGNDGDECSAAYAAPAYQNGNARRLPDAWLDTYAPLPLLAPGETAAITFRAMVLEDASSQEDVEAQAVLRSASRDEHHATTHLDIVRLAEIDVDIAGPTIAESGGEISYEVSITNTGQTDLTNVTFGIEETCDVRYVPGTLEIRLPEDETKRDDQFLIDQRHELRDAVYNIGALAAWKPSDHTIGDPAPRVTSGLGDNEVKISLTMQIASDVDPSTIAGPRFIVNADHADRSAQRVAGMSNRSLRSVRMETEIRVIESVTETTDGISPFRRGIEWFGEWAITGVLASFVAGLVLPFTLWRAARWLGSRMILSSQELAWLGFGLFGLPVMVADSVWAFVTAQAGRRLHGEPRHPGEEDEGG